MRRKKNIFLALIILVSLLFLTYIAYKVNLNNNDLVEYNIETMEVGKVKLRLPKDIEDLDFDGVHLLMKESEMTCFIPSIIEMGKDYRDPNKKYENYKDMLSTFSVGEYKDQQGNIKPNHILEVYTLKTEDNIFGIKLNQSFLDASKVLENNNFKCVDYLSKNFNEDEYIYYKVYKKGDFYITLVNMMMNEKLYKHYKDNGLEIFIKNRVRIIYLEIYNKYSQHKIEVPIFHESGLATKFLKH